jgi:hypothetical protein
VAGSRGLTWQAVEAALRKGSRGLPERRGRGKLDPGRRRRAAELRAGGLSLADVGRRLGVSKQAVHQLLRAAAAKEG